MGTLITQLNCILHDNSGIRVNGRVASERTKTAAGESLRSSFKQLVTLGFRMEKPENLSEKHIKALCTYWYENKVAISTMQTNLSNLRKFSRWIGKGQMVKPMATYLPHVPKSELQVKKVATSSKSWAAQGIDVAQKLRDADALDLKFGAMLRAALAFGIRRHEAIECYPWKVDQGDIFAAYRTKGGKPRNIYVDTNEQRRVLDLIKSVTKKNEHLGWTAKNGGHESDIKYSLNKWHKMLAKIGISKQVSNTTAHGLRAQFAENAALIFSVIPPTLGGTGGQMGKTDLNNKRGHVSQLLGHRRVSITSSYYGSFGRNTPPDAVDRTKLVIEAAVQAIPPENIKDVTPERINDCLNLTAELMSVGAYVEPRIAHALWECHSIRRHATAWVSLSSQNVAALEVAAKHFVSLQGVKS